MLYRQVIKSSVILEKERHGLKWHVHTLRDTVKELEEMHSHAEKKYEAIKEVRQFWHFAVPLGIVMMHHRTYVLGQAARCCTKCKQPTGVVITQGLSLSDCVSGERSSV